MRKRQAGFVSWAALAILLALAPILGIGIVQCLGEPFVKQQFERGVVLFVKDVFVSNTAKQNLSNILLPIELNMPIRKPGGVWLKDFHRVLNSSDEMSVKRGVIKSLTDRDYLGKTFWRTQAPFHFGNESRRFPVVLDSHSSRVMEVLRFWPMLPLFIRSIVISRDSIRATAEYVSPFSSLSGIIDVLHGEPSDNHQAIGKEHKRNIGNFGFTTQER